MDLNVHCTLNFFFICRRPLSGPDFDLKVKKTMVQIHMMMNTDRRSKDQKLPSWKFGKGISGKSPKVSGDVDIVASLKGPHVDILEPGVNSPDIKDPDLKISVPRDSGPDFDLKAKKSDNSDSDDDEHGW